MAPTIYDKDAALALALWTEPLKMSEREDIKKLMRMCGLTQDAAIEIYMAHGKSFLRVCQSLGVTAKPERYSLSPSTSRSPPAPAIRRQIDNGVEVRRVTVQNVKEQTQPLHKKRNVLIARKDASRCWSEQQQLQSQVDILEAQINGIVERSHRNMVHLDLHWMTVKGAVAFAKKAYLQAKNGTKMTIITGVGNNSEDNVAKIKPAIKKWLEEDGIRFKFTGGIVGLTVGRY